MARPTKINELIWLISFYPDGVTRTQLLKKRVGSFVENGKVIREVIYFTATTLDRLLKTLIDKGLVEKELVRSGRKGRPMGKYKIVTKQPGIGWGSYPFSVKSIHSTLTCITITTTQYPVFTVPNMERTQEGKLLLVRKVRDCSPHVDGRKHVKKTVPVGDYIEKYSNVIGDRSIKINSYKERFSAA